MFRTVLISRAALLLAPALVLACGERKPTPLGPSESQAADSQVATSEIELAAAALPSNTWQHFAALPTERRNVMLATVLKANGDTRLFAIAGDLVRQTTDPKGNPVTKYTPIGTVNEWNPATNTWAKRANTPYVWGPPVPDAVGIGSKIYVPGGYDRPGDFPRNTMAVYDVPSNTWTTVPLPQLATRGAVWSLGGQLYWYGRCDDNEVGGGDAPIITCAPSGARPVFLLRYNPSTGAWTYLATPITNRDGGVTGPIGGMLYLAGGNLPNLDAYDVATNRWSARAQLQPARAWAGGDAVKAKLYVAGGFTPAGDGGFAVTRDVSEYDPATNTWRNRARLPVAFPANIGTRVRATQVRVGGQPRLAVVGGFGDHWQWTP